MQVIVKDRDKTLGISSSEALGVVEVDLLKCFENVGVWMVNNLFRV